MIGMSKSLLKGLKEELTESEMMDVAIRLNKISSILKHEAVKQFSLWGNLSVENLEKMKAIQKIISIEEKTVVTLDEVLTRVLQFYRKFVPYNTL